MKSVLVLLAFSLAATGIDAQDAAKPLNLRLPADYVPASSGTAPAPPTATQSAPSSAPSVASKNGGSVAVTPARRADPPGTYYGDTTGRMANVEGDDDEPRCDDATYNAPQMHGSVGTGVVSASHGGSGSYQSGVVNLSQAFGSCDHPRGGVSISPSSACVVSHGMR